MTIEAKSQLQGGGGSAWRLPTGVIPERYEIRLAPDLEAATFRGEVRIACNVASPASEIVLNAADLEIEHVVVESDGRELPLSVTTVDAVSEMVSVGLAGPLAAGDQIFVAIRFTGVLNDQLRGFYRSTFTPEGAPEGEVATIATTHFEAADARRAFPCFDEPEFKAVFSVTVDVPKGQSVWSNWPVEKEEPLTDGGRRVLFGDTMKMSSYLVAVIVGPLVQTEPVDVDGTPVSVVHVPGKEKLATFALEAAAHCLRFFTEYFGIPYPATKLDLVALPDFPMGAMENLGCVTFRENALLVDPDAASLAEMQRVAQVVEHEIAHMWFGDLVTMRWWEGIWLNEAFATFMEVTSGDNFRPEWDLWTSFGSKRELAMAIDALHSTRPIEYPVGRPEEADGMFDPLTYEKGAGVLRMLEQYIGPEKFRDGIRLYLKKHSYGNTDTPDLWSAIEEASGHPVGSIMDTWIHQGGFPLVKVEDREGGSISVSQSPFMYAETADGPSSIGQLWEVPVLYRFSHDSEIAHELLGGEDLVLDPLGKGTAIVNAGGSGVYRVQYPPAHLSDLAGQLQELSTLERFYMLSDTWASVIADRVELGDFLSLLSAMKSELDPDVWGQATAPLALMDKAVPDSVRPSVAAYTRALAGPVFERLGWNHAAGDSERVRQLRTILLGALGTTGADPGIRRRCMELFAALVSDGTPLDPQLAPAIVATVAASGGPAEYDAFVERYRHPATPQEEMRYLMALAGFEDEALAQRTFELAMTEVRTANAPLLISMLLANRATGEATWRRVTERWDELLSRIPTTLASRMLEGTRLLCRDPQFSTSVRAFLSDHPIPSGERSVEQTSERLGINTALANRLHGAGQVLDQAAASLRL